MLAAKSDPEVDTDRPLGNEARYPNRWSRKRGRTPQTRAESAAPAHSAGRSGPSRVGRALYRAGDGLRALLTHLPSTDHSPRSRTLRPHFLVLRLIFRSPQQHPRPSVRKYNEAHTNSRKRML